MQILNKPEYLTQNLRPKSNNKAFTLIELLIVVAIIAILAAIAVPNFLEAQTRAKISRTVADMRTIELGIETYYLDNNGYPTGFDQTVRPGDPGSHSLFLLSTPISYLSSGDLQDPFNTEQSDQPMFTTLQYDPMTPDGRMFSFYNIEPQSSYIGANEKATWWILFSIGPDNDSGFTYDLQNPPGVQYSVREADTDLSFFLDQYYDSSNGTISQGNIWRAGGSSLNEAGKFIDRND